MKENFSNESNNKWTRIFKKKWFFPALYLMIAAFLLTAVLWFQNVERKLSEGLEDFTKTEDLALDPFEKEAEPVVQQTEIIKMPVSDAIQTEIVTKFFDYDAEEDREKGLQLYNNRYYQSKGVDIASTDGETFDVIAPLSGTVIEVKEDPLYGQIVILDHGSDITTYYTSLSDVLVDSGTKLKQGDKIGSAGKNLFGQEIGTHVHFELRKGDIEVNPEQFFNEPLSKLEQYEVNEQPNSEGSQSELESTKEDSDDDENDEEEVNGEESSDQQDDDDGEEKNK